MSSNFDLYEDDGMGDNNPAQSSTDYGDLIGEESTPVETGSITPPRPTGYVPYKPPTANTLSNAIASGSGIKSEVKVEPIQSTQAKQPTTLPQNPNLPMRPIAGISSARLASGGTSISGASGVKSTMSALYLGDLHWWTNDAHIKAACANIDVQVELKDIAFSEHKINGKSKGLAYVECGTAEKAALVKSWFETNEFQNKKITAQLCPGGSGQNPFKTLPREPNARHNNNNYTQNQNQNQNQNQSNYNNNNNNNMNNYQNRTQGAAVAGSAAPATHVRPAYNPNFVAKPYHINGNPQPNNNSNINNGNLKRDPITKTYSSFPSNVTQLHHPNHKNSNPMNQQLQQHQPQQGVIPFPPPPPGGFNNYPVNAMMGMGMGMPGMPGMGMNYPGMMGMGMGGMMGGQDGSAMWGAGAAGVGGMNGFGGFGMMGDMTGMTGMMGMNGMMGMGNISGGATGGTVEEEMDGSRKRSRMDGA